jgi:acyl-coenzyme A thioesterase 13
MDASSLGADDARTGIKGNLPLNVKQMLERIMHEVMARPNVYGASIGERVSIVEASIVPKTEESTRTEARVVCEVTVTEGPSIVKCTNKSEL